MQKGLVFLSVGLSVGVVVVSVAACGEDGTSNTFPDGQQDASFDTGPGFVTDGTVQSDVKQPVVCNPSLPVTFKPVWKPPTKTPGACASEALFGDHYDACLGPLKPGETQESRKQKCADWVALHKDCADCIQRADNTGPIQYYNDERTYYGLNQGGCIALVQNAPEEGKCGAAFDGAAQCRRESCDDCIPKGGEFGKSAAECESAAQKESPTTVICCQVKASNTGCKSLEAAQDSACVGYRDPDGGASDCFRKSSESERDLYVRVEGLFCGP